jgi:hypothetical protein
LESIVKVTVQRIGTLADLEALGEEWHAIQAEAPARHVLLDHRWVAAWWRHFGAGKAQHTLVLRLHGRAVGIVPLVLSRGWEAYPARESHLHLADDYRHLPALRWRRLLPIRRLTFPVSIASANPRGHLLLTDDDPALYEAVARYCADIAREWDMTVLDGLPEGAGQDERLRTASTRATLTAARGRRNRSLLRARLPASYDAFLAGRSGHFRRWLRRECRRAEQRTAAVGRLHVRTYRGASVDVGMTTLLALETRSWKAGMTRQRRVYVHLDAAMRAFFREVASAFAATDQAQVLILEVGTKPAAALLSLERDGVTLGHLTYLAQPFAERVSLAPLWQVFVQQAIAAGIREIDFNGVSANLMKWADHRQSFSRLVLYNRRPYSQLLRLLADGAHRAAAFTSARLRTAGSGI